MTKTKPVIAILLALSFLGGGLILSASRYGVGVGYDSYFYLTTARNLAEGKGLQWESAGNLQPLVHYPPLYPVSIAFVYTFTRDLIRAATVVSAILIGMNVFLIGWIVYRFTTNNWLSFAASIVAMSSPILLDIHFEAMSEPLFLTLMLLSLLFLEKFLHTRKNGYLLISALAASAGFMTRYVGAALVGAAVISLLWLQNGSRRKRLKDLLVFIGLGLLPVIMWYARNFFLTGSTTNRTIGFHPPGINQLRQGAITIAHWFTPTELDPLAITGGLILISLLFMVWIGWTLRKEYHKQPNKLSFLEPGFSVLRFLIVLTMFCGLYIGMLLASLTMFDASTKLNNRILSPIYIAVLLISFISINLQAVKFQRVSLVILFLLLIIYLPRSYQEIVNMYFNGRGFNSRTWQSSELVSAVNHLEKDSILYSNEAFPLEFLTGRPVLSIPEAYDSLNQKPRHDLEKNLHTMRSQLRQPGSRLVLFLGRYRPEYPAKQKLIEGLSLLVSTEDGAIYIDPSSLDSQRTP